MSLTDPRPDATAPGQTALIVLGMHRSGTSALAGVLGQLGVALPRDLMAPADMNAKGFFESNRITALNDRILRQVGMTWWDTRAFPGDWLDGPQAAAILDEARLALTADYGDAPLFVIKDPRMCRLMPFWRRALEAFGAQVRVVHTHRAAWDVAASLARWADYEPEYGVALWTRHVLDAEAGSRDLPRCFVSYDGLMTDWRAVAGHIAQELSLDWPRGADQAADGIDDFLSADLHHFHDAATTGPDGQPLPQMAARLQDMLAAWQHPDAAPDARALDRMRAALDMAGPLYDPLALRTVHRAREVRRLTARIDDLQTRHRAEVDRVLADRQEVVQNLAAARARLTRAGQIGDQHLAQIAQLSQRLVSVEDRLHVAMVQQRQSTRQQQQDLQERLRLAIALDDPGAMSARLSDLTDRVDAATSALVGTRAQLEDRAERAEADLTATRAALQAELAAASAAHAQLQADRDHARAREVDLLSSTSWRVTAPLRALSRVVRRRG